MASIEQQIKWAEEVRARGNTLLIEHLKGKRLKASDAIVAKCAECMSHFIDGKEDCKMPTCPLYPWMPYREKK